MISIMRKSTKKGAFGTKLPKPSGSPSPNTAGVAQTPDYLAMFGIGAPKDGTTYINPTTTNY